MIRDLLNLAPANLIDMAAAASIFVLLVLLLASFLSRPRVFCQYLKHMTGIELKPGVVRSRFHLRGRGGVRDLLIDLLIREDLADPSRVVTPDSKPDLSVFEQDG